MFIKCILNIPDVKKRFINDRFGFLKEIIRNHVVRVPFQSVTSFGSVKLSAIGRPSPTLQNVLHDTFRGVGGMCAYNNYSLRLQLESIGYNVQTVSGCFRRTGVPNSHFITLVKLAPNGQSPEKQYIVDVGCGIPLCEPVSLDDLPHHGRAGGLNFRYEWIDENNIQRIHDNGDAISGEQIASHLSPQDYSIELTPKVFSDFHDPIFQVYSNPKQLFSIHGVYCFRYLSITEDDFEIVCIRGMELIRITKETRTSQVFPNFNELRPMIDEFFPMLDPAEVDRAIENHNQSLKIN